MPRFFGNWPSWAIYDWVISRFMPFSSFTPWVGSQREPVPQLKKAVNTSSGYAPKMNIDSNPLVTVVVPSYNQGRYVENTVQSILNQDYPNIEVIVIDGGSTDQTLEVLERYKAQITFFSEADNGQSHAINKGFRLAKGEIVAWLNSDDIYPDRRAVGRMVEAFIQYPSADLIYGDFIEIDSDNLILKIFKRPSYSLDRLLRVGYISQPATFFRRRVIEKMPVREDLRYAMDLEYWLRADSLHFSIRHIKYLIAAERIHDEAKCVRDNSEMASEAREVRASYGASFGRSYPVRCLVDRLWLFLLRLPGVLDLMIYKKRKSKLTIPLKFDGAVYRTLVIRSLF